MLLAIKEVRIAVFNVCFSGINIPRYTVDLRILVSGFIFATGVLAENMEDFNDLLRCRRLSFFVEEFSDVMAWSECLAVVPDPLRLAGYIVTVRVKEVLKFLTMLD